MQSISFYQQFLNDPNALANGHQIIKNYLKFGTNNRKTTLQNLLHPQIPIITLVGHVYPYQVYPQLSQQQKNNTRVYLSQLLYNNIQSSGLNSKHTKSIETFINKIHKVQGYQSWLTLYTQIVQNLPSKYIINFFCNLLSDSDDRISPLAKQIYQYVLSNFTNQQLKPYMKTQSVLQILYYCIRSFVHLINTSEQQQELEEQQIGYKVLGGKNIAEQLLQYTWSNIKVNAICMKFSLKLLTILYGDIGFTIKKDSTEPLISLGYELLNNYLSSINNPHEQFTAVNLEQQQDQSNQASGVTFTVLIHQYIELMDTLLEHSQQFSKAINIKQLIYLILLACTSMLGQFQYWQKYSDQYLLALEDESQRTLRNRCCDFLNNMLDKYSPHHYKVKQQLRNIYDYMFNLLSQETNQQNLLSLFQQYIDKNISQLCKVYQLMDFTRIEEALYFILFSCYSQLYSATELQAIVYTLGSRIMNTSNILIKIAGTQLCVAQITANKAKYSLDFLIKIAQQNKNYIGLILSVSRGLAKCVIANDVHLTQQLYSSVLQPQINYLCQPNLQNQQQQVVSYIPLQLFLKIMQSSPQNHSILAHHLTAQFQLLIIEKYMHDGMVSSVIIQLLSRLQNPQIIQFILTKFSQGAIHDQKFGILVGKWIANKAVSLNISQISSLLHNYKGPKRQTIKNIISSWLSINTSVPNFKNNADNTFLNLINDSPDSSWLVYMLSADILINGQQLLLQTIKEATSQTSFPSEFENKLTLPFYVGLNYTQRFLDLLSKIPYQNSTLYQKFMTKFFQYSQYFKGDHLKIIASLFMLKICEHDHRIVGKCVQIIDKYGKLEADQWQDENQDVDQDQIMDRLLGGKIINDQLEKQLQQVFKENAWASHLVEQKLKSLKSTYNQ